MHPAVARKPCETFIIQSPRIEGTRREWNTFRLDIFPFSFSFSFSPRIGEKVGKNVSIDANCLLEYIYGNLYRSMIERKFAPSVNNFDKKALQISEIASSSQFFMAKFKAVQSR